jgi:CubicO group peptidase (beta-lactamase class C family)
MLAQARRAVTIALLGLVPLPPQPAGVAWPTGEWPTGELPAGAGDKLEPLLAVTQQKLPGLGETRAVVIIQHGKLVAEKYAPGFGADMPLLSWSMAKSVTQALLGIAVRQGLVDIDKPMGNPHWQPSDRRAAIPWRNWINMIDGQHYEEIGKPNAGDASRMLYGEGRRDVAAFGATLPLIHDPGTFWNYNSAGINLISDALARVLAPNTVGAERRSRMIAVLRDELFQPIGMKSAQPEFDAAGNFVGSAWVYATARDWAKFGLLYLRDGVWDGRRILPEGWVDFARAKTPADNSNVYGAGFWITPDDKGKPYAAVTPNGPRDLFLAEGHEGQVVVIVPSKDLVIVRLGLFQDAKGFHALGEWLEKILALF